MIIKHNEIQIDSNDPFLHCKLGRKKYAEVLTGIVSSYADGFVLTVNNPWGTGKTTFLKMWQRYLQTKDFKTVYFNAWEHDFGKDPMMAIMGEMKGISNDHSSATWKSVLKKGGVLATKVLPAAVKGFAKRHLGEEAVEIAVAGAEGVADVLKEQVDDYVKKKKGLEDFRKALQNYVKENSDGKPLIFIIDELDRCRPDYAVEMLERVKHFFSVEGIVFVLAIDKPQLLHAIKGFYGSADINTEEYLRRFIDIEYSIPAPSPKEYCKYLFQYFHFEEFFLSEYRFKHPELKNDAEIFIEFSTKLVEHHKLTLRQQEKLFAHARLVLRSFLDDHYNFPALFIVLSYIRSAHKTFYESLGRLELPIQEMINGLHDFLPEDKDKYSNYSFRSVESLLAFFYHNSYREKYPGFNLFVKDENGNHFPSITSAFQTEDATDQLRRRFEEYRNKYDTVKLEYLLAKIDLLEHLVK